MKNRILKCLALFVALVVFIACAGLLFPESSVISTDSDKVTSRKVLVPCGNSVGVQMDVKGALVVGTTQECNAQIGDMIVGVNNTRVNSPEEINRIVSGSEQTVKIKAIRNGETVEYAVTPYYDTESCEYKLGLWIKEKIAGIGTLTFYDPRTDRFAALGHGIYEPETGALLTVEDGKLLNTQVDNIVIGRKGNPGEIGGTVFNFDKPLGNLIKNTPFGIVCNAEENAEFSMGEPMVIAQASEVEKGEAYILTTVKGTNVQRFTIELTKVKKHKMTKMKSIEFRVTDEKLLEKSGGIVQGMSGSPIIQDGKLVGAVTHVLVNDPTRGYGIFIENMLDAVD